MPEQVAIVIAAVAALRRRVPKLDGAWVVLAVALVAALVSLAQLAQLPAWAGRGIMVFVLAVGGVSVAQDLRRGFPNGGQKPG